MKNLKILIVDDSELFASATREFLVASAGIESVTVVLSGAEALARVKDLKPDLVLTDLNMPGMNGLEVTRAVKESWATTKVIVV